MGLDGVGSILNTVIRREEYREVNPFFGINLSTGLDIYGLWVPPLEWVRTGGQNCRTEGPKAKRPAPPQQDSCTVAHFSYWLFLCVMIPHPYRTSGFSRLFSALRLEHQEQALQLLKEYRLAMRIEMNDRSSISLSAV